MSGTVDTEGLRTGVLAALAGLDLMTIPRLRALLAQHDPAEALAVAAGRARPGALIADMVGGPVGRAWRASAALRDPTELARRCRVLGIRAVAEGDDDFPAPLRLDPDPPGVLFVRGELAALEARRVGVVGTRNATGAGREVATASGTTSPRPAWSSCPGWPRASTAPPIAECCGPPVRRRSGSSATASTGRTRGSTPSCGAPSPPAGRCSPSGRRARRPSRSASRCATASSQGSARSSWSSRAASGAGRLITAMAAIERDVDVMAVRGSPHSRASVGKTSYYATAPPR